MCVDFVYGLVIGWIAGQTCLIVLCIIISCLRTACNMR